MSGQVLLCTKQSPAEVKTWHLPSGAQIGGCILANFSCCQACCTASTCSAMQLAGSAAVQLKAAVAAGEATSAFAMAAAGQPAQEKCKHCG
jgi:hypothetical protein